MLPDPVIEDRPPAGFLKIDFARGRPEPTFNTHIGNLYVKRGEKGTRDEFVMGFRVQAHMCNPAGGLHGGMMMTVADLVGGMGGAESRGGVESVPFFEWGGKNADGSDGFAEHRPGWPMPISGLWML